MLLGEPEAVLYQIEERRRPALGSSTSILLLAIPEAVSCQNKARRTSLVGLSLRRKHHLRDVILKFQSSSCLASQAKQSQVLVDYSLIYVYIRLYVVLYIICHLPALT